VKPIALRLLEEALGELASARAHLNYSFKQIANLPDPLPNPTEAELESAEAFTSRFARCVDLFVNKVLRALDRAELKPQGTLLDVVNNAEKRGFIARASELREMKDVRNIIAHDYAGKRLPDVLAYCRQQKAVFDKACDLATAYAKELL
jgi:uncharacterized protein YutE (UPF0331/DUF86 family)